MPIKYLMCLCYCFFMLGCSSSNITKINVYDSQLFSDDKFIRTADVEKTEDIFYLTDEQKLWLNTLVKPSSNQTLTRQLIQNLFQKNYLGFSYDNSFTRTASETLESRTGNCLSMVILSVAIAKHFELDYKIFDIKTVPLWNKDGGLFLLSGHVNIQLENSFKLNNIYSFIQERYLTLDFLPVETRRTLSKNKITERELVAIYFTNRAADAMVKQEWNKAYWLLKESIDHAPLYNVAWNSLGVIYKRNSYPNLAESVYKHALNINPNDTNVIANYAILLARQGRDTEVANYKYKIEKARLENPYRYSDKAKVAYDNQNFSLAIKLYKKAIKLSPFVDQFYFGLFQSYLAVNEMRLAVRSLVAAREHSARIVDRNRYNMKLTMLANR